MSKVLLTSWGRERGNVFPVSCSVTKSNSPKYRSCSEGYKGAGIQVSTYKCRPGCLRRQIHLLRSSSHSLG